MVNDFELIVPKYFANKVIRNKKPKLRLMNPVSKERNIASRKNQLVIPIKRKNVRKPMLIEVKNEPVDTNKFTPTDRERLERYNPIDDLEQIKQSKTLKFKNETRGLPFVLYANLKKKNYTPEQLEKMVRKLLALLGFDYDDLSKKQQEVIKDKVEQRMEFNESREEVDVEVASDQEEDEEEYEVASDEEDDDKLSFTKKQIKALKDEPSYLNSLKLGSKKKQEQALMKIPIARLYTILAILKNEYFEKEGYFTLEDRSIMNFTRQNKSGLVNLILLEQNNYDDASLLGLIEDDIEPVEEPVEEEEEVEKKLTKAQKERLELEKLKDKEREAKLAKAVERLRKVVQGKLQRIREAITKRDEEKAKKELEKARKALLIEQKKQKEAEKVMVDAKLFNKLMKEFMEIDIPDFYQSVKDTLSKITYDDLKQSIAEIKQVEGKGGGYGTYKLNMFKDRGGVTYSGDEVEKEFLKTFKLLNQRFRLFNEKMKVTKRPRQLSIVTNEIISTLVYKLNQLLFFHRVEIKQFYNYTSTKNFPHIISEYDDDLNKYLSSFTIENNNVTFESKREVNTFFWAIIQLNRFNTHTPEMLEVISRPVILPRMSYRFPDEFKKKLIKVQHLLPPIIEKLYSLFVWKNEDEGKKDNYYGFPVIWTGLMKNRRSYTDLTDNLEVKGQSWKAISKYLKENKFSIGGLVSRKENENTLTLKYQFGNKYYIYGYEFKSGNYTYEEETIEEKAKKEKVEGKGLKDTDFKNIIEATYKPREVKGWTLDKSISSNTSKVWKKNDGNQVVIAHRGTQGFLDWANNAMFAMGGEMGYKLTPRYKEAYRVQKLAERKYGRDYKISTIGHSQGGLQAQLLGHRSDETITFNKATRPSDLISASKQRKNQYDYSTRGDPVSIFRSPFEKYKSLNIKGSYNPLHAHSIKSVKESGEIYGDKSF